MQRRSFQSVCSALLFSGALFLGSSTVAHAQNVTLEVLEPVENGAVVFQKIGPPKSGAAKQGRISMRMRVRNNESQAIKITKFEIMDKVVSNFSTPIQVNPGATYTFQNCRCGDPLIGKALVINEPFPFSVKVEAYLQNYTAPVTKVVPIQPHTNVGGPLPFTGKANDLRQNEAWGTGSDHASDHQVFALDMGVVGWNKTGWSETFSGSDPVQKYSYRVYGMPVYAMTDGTVCFALNDHRERPTIKDWLTISPSLGKFYGGGNSVFVKNGSEISFYAHLQPGSIPQELLQTGAQVKKGQYLGKVGLSGSTSHPHIHINVKKGPTWAPNSSVLANGCDSGTFRPMTFKNLQSLTKSEATTAATFNFLLPSLWTPLTNHSAPHPYSLLYPSTASYKFCATCSDTKQYIGVWRAGNSIDLRVKAAGWTAFTQKWQELSNDKFRLVEIETFVENGQRQFLGIFKRGTGGHYLWNVAGWSNFTTKVNALKTAGYRLVDLSTYSDVDGRHYVGVFRAASDKQALINVTEWAAFTSQWAQLSNQGYRLVDIETHAVGALRQYIGVFRQGTYGHALWSITGWTNFTNKWKDFANMGLRLVDLETFAVGSQRQFVGVFRQGTDGYALASVKGYDKFIQESERWNAQGLRLVDIHVEQ